MPALTPTEPVRPAVGTEPPGTPSTERPPSSTTAAPTTEPPGDSDENPVTKAAKDGATSEHPEEDMRDVAAGGETTEQPAGTEASGSKPLTKEDLQAAAKAGAQEALATQPAKEPTQQEKDRQLVLQRQQELRTVQEERQQLDPKDPDLAQKIADIDKRIEAATVSYRTVLLGNKDSSDPEIVAALQAEAGKVAESVLSARLGEKPDQATIDALVKQDPAGFLKIVLDNPDGIPQLPKKQQRELRGIIRGLAGGGVRKGLSEQNLSGDQVEHVIRDAQARALFGNEKDWKKIKDDFHLGLLIKILSMLGWPGAFALGFIFRSFKEANPMQQQHGGY